MSKKDYEEQENQSLGDKVKKTAGVALGLFGATSLLYHSGVNKFLSKDLDSLSKTFDYIKKDVSSTPLKNLDADAVKDIANKRLLNPNSTYKTLKNKKEEIWFEKGKNDLLNTLYNYFSFKENPENVLKKTFSANYIGDLKESVRNKYSKDDDFLKHKLDNYINNVVTNFNKVTEGVIDDNGEIILNKEFAKKFKDETNIALEDQQKIFKEVLDVQNKIDTKFNIYKNSPEAKDLIDEITDKMLDPDSLEKKFGKQGFFEKVLDEATDNRATLKDLLNNKDKLKGFNSQFKKDNEIIDFNFLEKIEELVNEKPELENLFLNKDLKVDSEGNLLSFKKVKQINDKMLDEGSNTIWGKILKVRDFKQDKEAPSFRLWTAGEHDVVLGDYENRLLKKPKKSNTMIANNYAYINDKVFKIEDNHLSEIKELKNLKLINGKYGSQINTLRSIMGDIDYVDPNTNKVLNKLDLFNNAELSPIEKTSSIGKKFSDPNWIRNISKKIQSIDDKDFNKILNNDDEIIKYNNMLKKINSFYNSSADNLNKETILKMKENTKGTAKSLLSTSLEKNEKMMDVLTNRVNNEHKFYNSDLVSLIKKHINDPKKAIDTVNIAKSNGVTKAFSYYDLVRRELTKEAMLQHVFENNEGKYNSILDLFKASKLSNKELNKAGKIANWAIFQKNSLTYNKGVSQKNRLLNIQNIKDAAKSTQKLFSGESEKHSSDYLNFFKTNFNKMVEDNSSVFEKGKVDSKKIVHKANYYGNWTLTKKGIRAKDVLKNINDETMIKSYFKQYVAGRDDVQNITTKTFVPYFAVNRLVDPLKEIGLGFSSKNTSNVVNLASNVFFKRALPLIAVGKGLSYLDYRTEAYAGTSLRGRMTNGLANIDLGLRKVSDKTGLTNIINENKRSNVMSQYISDNEDFQSYDERKQFYESGYVPVRKGRWWSFGSTSEWKGGKIQYYQPNFVLRANSNWYDNSVYGSTKNKWKHSFIPTPRHPLAPIRRLTNPYWLENYHYWDRPYPMTGKMFEENTPWGPALNATVGRVLKPQHKMHQRELGNSLLDVRDLIAEENKKIYDKAGNNRLVRLDSKFNVEPVSFSPLGAPTVNERVLNFNTNKNGKYINKLSGNEQYGTSFIKDTIQYSEQGFTFDDKFEIEKQANSFKGQIFKGIPIPTKRSPTNYVAHLNKQTINKAKGVITPDAIFKTKAKGSNYILHNKEALADLKHSSNTKQFLQDSWYNANQLLGVYGFMINSITPDKKSYRLDNASNISSVSRRFWGKSIGGYGGEFMEIARRFLPHENHNIEKVNPIRNTMPDWMPQKFMHGDPYSQIPKGEMRLPGKGYESMYKLHSDMYGSYGAYDRFKILADVAPWSREYKTWRSIASQTVKDPKLQQQMKNIKTRVNKQSKNHDFYEYKFKNANKINTERAVVDKILSNNTFTLVGKNEVYNLAGINVKDKLNNHLKPGNKILVKTNKDKSLYYNNDDQRTINATVYLNNENLNLKLLKSKVASENKDDNTPVGAHARFSSRSIVKGKVFERIAHAPIPFIHNKFMRVETPLESWKRHQIYGTEHSTWSHPIKSFIKPAFDAQSSNSLFRQSLAVGSFAFSQYADLKDYSKNTKLLSKAVCGFFNPAAVMGGTVGYISRLDKKHISKGMRIGGALGIAKYSYDHLDQPINSTIGFGMAGALITKQFFNKTKTVKEGALIGATVGLALSGMKNSGFNKRKMFGPYIPKKTKKQWEINEYYDRLAYIKYMGLYNKAARKAKIHEHVDIRKIMNKMEIQQKNYEKKIRKLRAQASKINSIYQNDSRKNYYLAKIKNEINKIKPNPDILKADKYTKAAITYKYAAESTTYGLKENATWAQLVNAIPKNSRDYFLEFAKETNKKKQKEISKYVSPYYQKILNIAWGTKIKKHKSNNAYFKKNYIPAPRWSGWKPDVDLEKIKIKEIKNEGLLLSDFGYYDSQLKEPDVKNAETNCRKEDQNLIQFRRNIVSSLNGAGLNNVKVTIEPTREKNKIKVVSNVIRTKNYKIKEKLSSTIGRIL